MKKRNNAMENLIWIAVVLIVIMIVAIVVFMITRQSRNLANETSGKTFEVLGEAADVVTNLYDNATVTGAQVQEAVTTYASGSLTVIVQTKMNTAGVSYTASNGYSSAAYASSPANQDYIKDTALFTGTVQKNANGVITSITFTQR